MAARERTNYTAEFKLNVIEKAEEIGNQEVGHLYNIDESNIGLWRKSKAKFIQTSRSTRSFRRGVPSWPGLEEELYRWIIEQCEKGSAASTVYIRNKAKLLSIELGIKNFAAGPT